MFFKAFYMNVKNMKIPLEVRDKIIDRLVDSLISTYNFDKVTKYIKGYNEIL